MTLRHWIWIIYALVGWALVTVLWATGPYHCSVPDTRHHVTCRHH